jgi:hypothetical protein
MLRWGMAKKRLGTTALEPRASVVVRVPMPAYNFFPANVVFAQILIKIMHVYIYIYIYRLSGNSRRRFFEDTPSTNNKTRMSYGKMPFNAPVLSKTFLNFRNVATSGLVTVHKYGLSVTMM